LTQIPIDFSRGYLNPQSEAAFATVNVTAGQRAVLDVLAGGPATSKRIAKELDRPLHSISGRLSELKAANRIRKTGKVIEGSAELELA
jgi:hypothetical protein